jgi:transcriptional regulator with XRE-family HTH domain
MKEQKATKRLRKYRMQAGLTIYSLADRLNVNSSTVSYWEKGERFPRQQKLEMLEDMFKVGYRELFTDLTPEEVKELEQH